MSAPRIMPGDLKELGIINYLIATLAGKAIGGGRPNIFTTLGRRRGLFRAWMWYSGKMMPFGSLPRRDTELVILHVATERSCEYERRHHERLGRRVGLTDSEIRYTGDAAWDGWTTRQKILLSAATELITARDLTDAAWFDLKSHLSEPQIIEFLMLVGQYDSLATTLMTLRVQPDP